MSELADDDSQHPLKRRPEGARQHLTAGPYSPVLEVDAQRLVVISGQIAIDHDGRMIGTTIEEQTKATLRACATHLASAGCTLGDVFKVNVYLADVSHWARFNTAYRELMPGPLPVRTTVQAVLLPGYLVEIEMWAVKARE